MMPSLAGPGPGHPAPDFTLDAVGGGRVSLRDFRGRPVLLIFLRHLG